MMDWKTILATIAFFALVLFQAKMNEENDQRQVEKATVNSSILHHNQASVPSK